MMKLLKTAPCTRCESLALIAFSFEQTDLCNNCNEEMIFDYADSEMLELLAMSLTSAS